MQLQGCRALTNLSCGGDEYRKAVRDANGASALIMAMEMHPEDLPLARLAPCSRVHTRTSAHAHARAPATPAPARPGDTVAGPASRTRAAWARLGWHRGSACAARGARNPVRCLPSGAPRVAPAPHGLTRPPARPAAAGCCPIQPRSSRQSASARSWRRSSCCSASTRMTSTGRTAPPGAACCSTPSGTACFYSLAGCCCAGLIPALLSIWRPNVVRWRRCGCCCSGVHRSTRSTSVA